MIKLLNRGIDEIIRIKFTFLKKGSLETNLLL
jgi:hypothetical protein